MQEKTEPEYLSHGGLAHLSVRSSLLMAKLFSPALSKALHGYLMWRLVVAQSPSVVRRVEPCPTFGGRRALASLASAQWLGQFWVFPFVPRLPWAWSMFHSGRRVGMSAAAFSPDASKVLASLYDGSADLYARTGERICTCATVR